MSKSKSNHTFNGTTFDTFREEIKVALADIEKTYGVRFELGNIRFTADVARFTKFRMINMAKATAGEVPPGEIVMRDAFRRFAWKVERYGFTLGDEFIDKKFGRMRIIGYRPRAKYNVICKRETGGTVRYACSAFKHMTKAD